MHIFTRTWLFFYDLSKQFFLLTFTLKQNSAKFYILMPYLWLMDLPLSRTPQSFSLLLCVSKISLKPNNSSNSEWKTLVIARNCICRELFGIANRDTSKHVF
jgi:hypothetical protein